MCSDKVNDILNDASETAEMFDILSKLGDTILQERVTVTLTDELNGDMEASTKLAAELGEIANPHNALTVTGALLKMLARICSLSKEIDVPSEVLAAVLANILVATVKGTDNE